MDEACVVLTTTDSEEVARHLSHTLVERCLAACVQRVDIHSTYAWEGALEEAREILLLVKTRGARYPEVEAWIRENHNYQVPEVLMLPAARVSSPYLDWLTRATTGGPNGGGQAG
jgi:periplasmic divalent cation tolerance protein